MMRFSPDFDLKGVRKYALTPELSRSGGARIFPSAEIDHKKVDHQISNFLEGLKDYTPPVNATGKNLSHESGVQEKHQLPTEKVQPVNQPQSTQQSPTQKNPQENSNNPSPLPSSQNVSKNSGGQRQGLSQTSGTAEPVQLAPRNFATNDISPEVPPIDTAASLVPPGKEVSSEKSGLSAAQASQKNQAISQNIEKKNSPISPTTNPSEAASSPASGVMESKNSATGASPPARSASTPLPSADQSTNHSLPKLVGKNEANSEAPALPNSKIFQNDKGLEPNNRTSSQVDTSEPFGGQSTNSSSVSQTSLNMNTSSPKNDPAPYKSAEDNPDSAAQDMSRFLSVSSVRETPKEMNDRSSEGEEEKNSWSVQSLEEDDDDLKLPLMNKWKKQRKKKKAEIELERKERAEAEITAKEELEKKNAAEKAALDKKIAASAKVSGKAPLKPKVEADSESRGFLLRIFQSFTDLFRK